MYQVYVHDEVWVVEIEPQPSGATYITFDSMPIGIITPSGEYYLYSCVNTRGLFDKLSQIGTSDSMELAIEAIVHNYAMNTEHNPTTCNCEYLGMNMWSCGHIDNDIYEVLP